MENVKTSDLEIDDELFSLFSDLIYRISGIKLNSQKKTLLTSRLTKRLRKCGIKGFYDYYKRVKGDEEELIEMLNCISTNTTNFFREKYHFEYLKNVVIPELLKNKSVEKTIRIWSAGCSTGEEPCSIAIAVCEALNKVSSEQSAVSSFSKTAYCSPLTAYCDWDIKILATDISTRALEIAHLGVYEHEELPDNMPEETIGRYFLKGTGENEGMVKVKDFLKDIIRFRRFNLKDKTYPFKKGFDVIFCRNVMIYFDENMKQHILSNFHYHLSDSGYLFLGHSETMFSTEKFHPVYTTVYRKI
jgi:chemotaxis protein methyltransferase CheR